MNTAIFREAADYARFYDPHGMNLLIAPIVGLPEAGRLAAFSLRIPLLYVTGTGYVPHATKSEIIRRGSANLFVLGGEELVSDWVVYVLSTFTGGRVYRIVFPS
ncbi:hypothetical protein AB6A23_20930 [Paenibacillus tarimensis]